MILQGVSFLTLKSEQLSEILTKIQNILNHWSVAQAGSYEEKNWRSKILLDCPCALKGTGTKRKHFIKFVQLYHRRRLNTEEK